jgi:[ribosomal protein S5]-alanine N-acetyltransferase
MDQRTAPDGGSFPVHPNELLPRVRGGVVLRRLAAGDLMDFQAYRGDLELGRYQGWTATRDDEAAAFLANMNTAPLLRPGVWSQIGIAEEGERGGRLVGDIGLLLAEDGREATIGFSLRRESHGKGIATRAVREAIAMVFENTEAGRVIANTDARNLASMRLLERVGMKRIATGPAVFRGEACMEHTYALERDSIPVG